MSRGVLVAGIGNLFLSDDAFGVEVANRLATQPVPPGVRVADFGIRGVHLAYELLDGYDSLILIDAVPMGEAPGTLAVIEPDSVGARASGTGAVPAPGDDFALDDDFGPVVDAHSMSPDVVLATLARLGGGVERIYVVGCQPATLEEGMGLSSPVAAAVDGAVVLCHELLAEMVQPAGKGIRK